MSRVCLSRIAIALSAFCMSSQVFPAAFQFYELGTPIIGTAAVGQAALANDASIAYFNPAAMTQLKTSQYLLGTQIILPYTHFSANTQNTISGDNGGNAASLVPGADLYFVYNLMPKLKLGVSFTSPYAGMLNYTNGWVGRYLVQTVDFFTLNLNPALAYQFNDWFALGGGASIEYAQLNQTVALAIPGSTDDGQANIKAENFAGGFNIGALLTPGQTTNIGVAYRSRIIHHLTGSTTFLRINSTPSTSTKMIMPQNVIISLKQLLSNQFNLVGELGWANWSSMRTSVVTIAGFSVNTFLNWNDTYRLGLGGQYKVTPSIMLQAGASYDSSPTNSTHRTPDLPMDRQIRVGTGLMYSVSPPIKLGFSYEYINFGRAPINNISAQGVVAGSYSLNYANVVQASINIEC